MEETPKHPLIVAFVTSTSCNEIKINTAQLAICRIQASVANSPISKQFIAS